MVATARITIHVFVTFSDCKESNETKLWHDRMRCLRNDHTDSCYC